VVLGSPGQPRVPHILDQLLLSYHSRRFVLPQVQLSSKKVKQISSAQAEI
jgi:hypothetical protein